MDIEYIEDYDNLLKYLIDCKNHGYFVCISRNKKYKYLKDYVYNCTKFLDNYDFNVTIATRIFYTLKHRQEIYRCCVDNKPYLKNLSIVFDKDLNLNHLHCCHNCAMKDNLTQDNILKTMMKKYKVKSYWQSLQCKDKMKDTCRKKYRVDFYTQSNHYKNQIANNVVSEITKCKLSKSGKQYWNSLKPEQKLYEIQRRYDSNKHNHGGVTYTQSLQYKNLWKDKSWVKIIKDKEYQTKKKNNSFNISRSEEFTYQLLIKKYGINDIIRQYKSESYPFACDFYIKSIDTYIECNYSWTHGGHFYNSECEDDIKTLNIWKDKKSAYYDNAIVTWTLRDVKKLQCAIKNLLNYKVYWKLKEAIDDLKTL